MTTPSSTTPLAEPIDNAPNNPDQVEVWGAREHNLKNLDISFPRNKLVVVTGISGSGKSSLAFDTIYSEGQRRYMESFSAYTRNFLGNLERPDVDKVDGLSPVIAIEQKTTSRNPRSTVGTTTEIYDYMRLLFARISEAYSYQSGQKMVKQTEQQIAQHILAAFPSQTITLLAPVVRGRKGQHKELLQRIHKMGFTRITVNRSVRTVSPKMQLDRYKTHEICIVIDRLSVDEHDERLRNSLASALKHGKGMIIVQDEKGQWHHFSNTLIDPTTGLSYDEPAPNSFSFNSPYGACSTCHGLGTQQVIDVEALMPDKTLSINQGGIHLLGEEAKEEGIFKSMATVLKKYHMSLDTPLQSIPPQIIHFLLYGREKSTIAAVVDKKMPLTTSRTQFAGIIPFLQQNYQRRRTPKMIAEYDSHICTQLCPTCHGARLKKTSLYFKIADKNIAQLVAMDMQQLYDWFGELEPQLSDRQQAIGTEIIEEIRKRIQFLLDVGLHYLQLDRSLQTLSGGEAQRIRLATQIGTQLVGVLYILDEPSIGLHQRDNKRLTQALHNLRDLGNSVLIVEHDKDMMLEADYIIDIGPGAGKHGGQIVAAGSTSDFLTQPGLTADFITGKRQVPVPATRRAGNGTYLQVRGCSGHNLKQAMLRIPLGKMIGITGVSGSGKSTLVHETLLPILQKYLYRTYTTPLPYQDVSGLENIDKVIEIDQKPIGRTPRSNPATYTGVFTGIRNLFTLLPEAKTRGYKPGYFSFNVKGGRCETCQGAGMKVIEMDFLPNVQVFCETCRGKRYNRQLLEVRYKGKSIADVLDMTVSNSVTFFEKYPGIRKVIRTLDDVGLGYITLGQHATTLSGGEAQRVKLASELAKRDTSQTLYILDEPTTGLHFQDIQHLLGVLHKLVDKGNTVVIVEHNLDIIKAVDYIIDIGPEGGVHGGQIVAEGTPEEVARHPRSYTGQFLKEVLP